MKFNPTQAIQPLISPLNKLTAISEAEYVLAQDIHKVLTIDLKTAAKNIASELSKQTSLLKDIKSLIKDKIKASDKASSTPGKVKMPGIKGALKTGVAIVIMAGALVAASGILTYMATPSPTQLLTALAIGALFVILTPMFVKISEAFKGPTLMQRIIGKITGLGSTENPSPGKMIAGVGLAMAAMAAGVALSSYFFAMVRPISYEQFATATLIGLSFVVLSVSFVLISRALMKNGITFDKKGINTLSMMTLSMVAIAVGIVGVAYVFKLLPANSPAPDIEWIIKSSLAIGLFAVGFYYVMKATAGRSLKEIAFGAVAIPMIALALVGIAYVFKLLPSNPPAPDFSWTLKTALAIGLFAVGFYSIMKAIAGRSLKEIAFGAVAIPLIALAIVGVAYIFQMMPESSKGPDLLWTLNAGLSILIFAIPFLLITTVLSKFNVGLKEILVDVLITSAIALAITAVAWIFTMLPDEFKTAPLSWSTDAAVSILAFSIPVAIIAAIVGATGGAGMLAIIGGVVGVILIAGAILAVSWILSKVPTEFVGGMENLTKGMMAPLNGMIDVLVRLKNEIGIENLPALAGGIVLLAGAWLTLVAALAGQALAGLGSSIANLGKTIIDGISAFFGGEKTKSPIDLLDMILNRADAIKKISEPIKNVATSFGQIAGFTGGVVRGLNAWSIFINENNANNLDKSASASERIADAYTKFAKAANGLNIKAVQASTEMFKSIAALSTPDAQNAMKVLTDNLLKAIEELSTTVLNLETAVQQQGDNNSGFIEQAGAVLGGAVNKAADLITNVGKSSDTKTQEQQPTNTTTSVDANTQTIASNTDGLIASLNELIARLDSSVNPIRVRQV